MFRFSSSSTSPPLVVVRFRPLGQGPLRYFFSIGLSCLSFGLIAPVSSAGFRRVFLVFVPRYFFWFLGSRFSRLSFLPPRYSTLGFPPSESPPLPPSPPSWIFPPPLNAPFLYFYRFNGYSDAWTWTRPLLRGINAPLYCIHEYS